MMKNFNIAQTSRKARLVLYSIPVVFIAGFIMLDLKLSYRVHDEVSKQRWPKLASMDIDEITSDIEVYQGAEKHMNTIRKEQYKAFKTIPNPVDEEESQFSSILNVLPAKSFEPQPPLIEFQRTNHQELAVEENGVSSKLSFPVGTMIHARLLMPIYSNDIRNNRSIYAELIKPVRINGRTLLISGTRFLGHIKQLEAGHAHFSEEWEFLSGNNEKQILSARLQEYDYKFQTQLYGSYDGAPGLRMRKLKIDLEPKVSKFEKLFDEVIKPIAKRRAQQEINTALEFPPIDSVPTDIFTEKPSNDLSDGREDKYYIPAGTMFYLWVL